jgi:ankyrin repeat protein
MDNPLLVFAGIAVFVVVGLFVRGRFNSIHSAARADWASKIDRMLLDRPDRVNERDSRGQTPLMHASRFGAMEAIRVLLKHGADVNAKCHEGGTALHWTAWFGQIEAAQILLEHGADPDVVDENGSTPVRFAVTRGHKHLAELLKDQVDTRRA